MGREIRKVKKGWEHPLRDNGDYHPMHDEYYLDALQEWLQNHELWLNGKHPDQEKENASNLKFFAEWYGNAPDVEYYRHEKWSEEEACCFQMYETVSEGTPVSPVFDTLQLLEDWMVINLNYSRSAAHSFCTCGHAPSFVISNGKIQDGISSYGE